MKYRVALIEGEKETVIYTGWNEGLSYLYYEALTENGHESTVSEWIADRWMSTVDSRDYKKLIEQGKDSFV